MGYQWYKLNGYIPFWLNNSTSLPDWHIEDYVAKDTNVAEWELIENKVAWNFPANIALLIATKKTYPKYLKCTDGTTNFYFCYNGIVDTNCVKDGSFEYRFQYEMDSYMTHYYNKLKILLDNNVSAQHIQAFTNRLEDYTVNEDNVITSFKFNMYKQRQFGNSIPSGNNQMVRNYLYSTTAQKLWEANFKSPFPIKEDSTSIKFTNWTGSNSTTRKAYNFTVPNANGRYQYIVCKSSALQTSNGTSSSTAPTTYATNDKIIIPVVNLINEGASPDYIIEGLMNIALDMNQSSAVNALSSGNFIGGFECDVPFSQFIGEVINNPNTPIKCEYGDISFHPTPPAVGTQTARILYFRVPFNWAPKWTLVNFSEYNKGFDGRIKNMFININNRWDEETEPTFLNPTYYQERYMLDNDKYLSSDMSLVEYSCSDTDRIKDIGLDLQAYIMFSSSLAIAYHYGMYTNQLNPLWNTKNSNVRTTLELSTGLMGSASANYYESNANTTVTSMAVRENEEIQSWVDAGFETAKIATDTAVSVASHPLGWCTGRNEAELLSASISVAAIMTDNAMTQDRKNWQLGAEIRNISSSPSTVVVDPYVDSCVPNIEHPEGGLFSTYSNELHPWDKQNLMITLMSNGYPINKVLPLSDYKNRRYMNILYINSTTTADEMMRIIKEHDTTLFNGVNYISAFIMWLSKFHRMYATDYIVNCINPYSPKFLLNLEANMPKMPEQRTDINTHFKNKFVGSIVYDINVIPNLKQYNRDELDIPAYEAVVNDGVVTKLNDTMYSIKIKDSNTSYYGEMLVNYVKPDTVFQTWTFWDNDETVFAEKYNVKTDDTSSTIWTIDFNLKPVKTMNNSLIKDVYCGFKELTIPNDSGEYKGVYFTTYKYLRRIACLNDIKINCDITNVPFIFIYKTTLRLETIDAPYGFLYFKSVIFNNTTGKENSLGFYFLHKLVFDVVSDRPFSLSLPINTETNTTLEILASLEYDHYSETPFTIRLGTVRLNNKTVPFSILKLHSPKTTIKIYCDGAYLPFMEDHIYTDVSYTTWHNEVKPTLIVDNNKLEESFYLTYFSTIKPLITEGTSNYRNIINPWYIGNNNLIETKKKAS